VRETPEERFSRALGKENIEGKSGHPRKAGKTPFERRGGAMSSRYGGRGGKSKGRVAKAGKLTWRKGEWGDYGLGASALLGVKKRFHHYNRVKEELEEYPPRRKVA